MKRKRQGKKKRKGKAKSRGMKVLLLGSGALKIGEAGEFDYSGSQAIKALKEEGIQVILVNPNVATIQTSKELADKVYFLPVNKEFAAKIIRKEKPDGILLSFGGQTALNCGIELEGILKKYGVKVLGTPLKTIKDTEDRDLFVKKLQEIGVNVPRSRAVTSKTQGMKAGEEIGFPLMVRVSYALGGSGSGIVRNREELISTLERAFAVSRKVLIEEYLSGWKEIEYEVVRDSKDNCVTVCNMENMDPMGFHTGESVVVAPSQTLTNEEYHKLREISIKVVRWLGIIGECNIQFALNPDRWDYRVIEVNARLSRSSALASKATGYPLAYVAAKLTLGKSMVDLKNSVTKVTTTCFEPSLDYIVLKIPRWDLQKFRMVEYGIGSEMKSVGEVMAIGRSFEEVLQKALRMLEIGLPGLVSDFRFRNLREELYTDKRLLVIASAFRKGHSIRKIHRLTGIDKWFLHKVKGIIDFEMETRKRKKLAKEGMLRAKKMGFSDAQIADMTGRAEGSVRRTRKKMGIIPSIKQIDTLAAEYPAKTNYLYMTYSESGDDVDHKERGVIVLGSGPYRIGSSVEFDWCAVNSVLAFSKLGSKTVMVNSNPETVSTDYDMCDRLYFEELTLERVLDICDKENPEGVVVSVGGQTPNNLALPLHKNGVPILGTDPKNINVAEDRNRFSALLDRLGVKQPEWGELTSIASAKDFASRIGYPVLIRPSFVLSGSAMSVAFSESELKKYLHKVETFYPNSHGDSSSVIITKFIEHSKEIEFDAVAKSGKILCYAVGEHIENAGVHSGDATIILPAQRIHVQTFRECRMIARKVARALQITGPFNIQFIAKENKVKVIECNLRASRTFPFVSKTYGLNFIDIAARAMIGKRIPNVSKSLFDSDHIGIKAPQFSFSRLRKADPILSVEMASTGEVACFGDSLQEAFLKSIVSTGFKVPRKSVLVAIKDDQDKFKSLSWIKRLRDLNFTIYATEHTSEFLRERGIENAMLHKIYEQREPNIRTYFMKGKIDFVINIPLAYNRLEFDDFYEMRRMAVDFSIPLITNVQLARLLIECIETKPPLKIKHWLEYAD
jgi:carbamoyl-phosphate synthase large subunit